MIEGRLENERNISGWVIFHLLILRDSLQKPRGEQKYLTGVSFKGRDRAASPSLVVGRSR